MALSVKGASSGMRNMPGRRSSTAAPAVFGSPVSSKDRAPAATNAPVATISQRIHAGDIAAGLVKAYHQTKVHRIIGVKPP